MSGSLEPQPQRARAAERFEALYAPVAPAVHAWAMLHVRPELRAELEPEDLVQEVTCRAFEHLDAYDPAQGPFRAWVFGIARRVLLSALRRIGAGPARTPTRDVTVSAHLDTATSVTRRVVRAEELREFLALAADLPEADRRLLLFRGLEGLSHEEVARHLGTTPRAAAKRWERLRARLQGSLDRPDVLVA